VLDRYLNKFERMIDEAHYEGIAEAYRRVFAWKSWTSCPTSGPTCPPWPMRIGPISPTTIPL
jgi:hypothetical protein